MNNCRKIRDLILTDYADGQLEKTVRQSIDKHISECQACSKFYNEVKSKAIDPFKNTERLQAPDYLWDSIAKSIEDEKAKPRKVFTVSDIFKAPIFSPKFSLAWGTFIIIILTAFILFKNVQLDSLKKNEMGAYLVNMLDSSVAGGADINGFGTPLEDYFL